MSCYSEVNAFDEDKQLTMRALVFPQNLPLRRLQTDHRRHPLFMKRRVFQLCYGNYESGRKIREEIHVARQSIAH